MVKGTKKFDTSYGTVVAERKKICETKREANWEAKKYRDKGYGLVRVVKSKDGYGLYVRQSW